MKKLYQILILLFGLTLIQSCGGDEELTKNLSDIFGQWDATSVVIDDQEQLPDSIENLNMMIIETADGLEWLEFTWIDLPTGDISIANSLFSIEDDNIQLDSEFSKWGQKFNVELVSDTELVLVGSDQQDAVIRISASKF